MTFCGQMSFKHKLLALFLAGSLMFLSPSWLFAQPSQKGAKQTEAKNIKAQIDQIDHELDQAVEQYNQANVKLDRIKAESASTSQKIQKAQQDLDHRTQVLNGRVRNIYKHGDVPFLETVFSTKTFEQFLCTVSRLQDVARSDADIVEDIRQLKQEIEEKKQQLLEQEQSQQAICGQMASNKAAIDNKLSERKNALVGVEEQISALEREEQAQAERLRAQVEQEQRQLQANPKPKKTPQVSRGGDRAPAPKSGVVGIAMAQLGKPYRWGGAGPDSFDCSGLVMYCYRQIGVSLPHSAAAQYGCGAHISRDQLAPGDLVFFSRGGGISHVGMYVGGDSYIHAPHTGDVVKISSLSARGPGYVGAVRP